ncbi:hypothetical protein B0J12DRAFT_667594 [Macrophomina phaseolina]|uniref:Uncharacterized protein n=1 Tax=Macrophomina phaseolina TaxID=35725 RepID=A0ABQ8G872_9PEZI|nr:hypothetical protein B0J12DRAFT_667594 [Macrophomina phaseolina]
MTCNITTPLEVEPLPLYQRDPETSSLLSSAPSYTSEAPTYHSSSARGSDPPPPPPPPQPQPYHITTSLLDISTPPPQPHPLPPGRLPPSTTHAPGYTSSLAPDPDAVLHANYNIGAWSSVASTPAKRRQYERVAMRRVSRAAAATTGAGSMPLLESSSRRIGDETIPPSTTSASRSGSGSGSPVGRGSRAGTPPLQQQQTMRTGVLGEGAVESGELVAVGRNASDGGLESAAGPASPHEDPALVGEEAAARTRRQRLYREACLRHDWDVRLVQEGKGWDFMLSQMADW